jgi:hydroxyacylglutathione hydrolase
LEDQFRDIIYKARFGWGYTPVDVAESTEIDPKRLHMLEMGEEAPTYEEVVSIARMYHLDEDSLWQIAQDSWRPEPMELDADRYPKLFSLTFSDMNANGYLLETESGAWMIDPGGSPLELKRLLSNTSKPLMGCLITHSHWDHCRGLLYLCVEKPDLTVVSHLKSDIRNISDHIRVDKDFRIKIKGLTVNIVESPGHSSDSLSFLVKDMLFTGDTIFTGSLGRASSGTYPQLLQSARKLLGLPRKTIILPGHGPATTVGEERQHNPFMAVYQW